MPPKASKQNGSGAEVSFKTMISKLPSSVTTLDEDFSFYKAQIMALFSPHSLVPLLYESDEHWPTEDTMQLQAQKE